MASSTTIEISDTETDQTIETDIEEELIAAIESGSIDSSDLKRILTNIGSQNITEEEFSSILAEVIIELLNSSSFDGKEFGDTISGFSTHSWLQHEYVQTVLLPTVDSLADTPTDKRNADAINKCSQMIDATDYQEYHK